MISLKVRYIKIKMSGKVIEQNEPEETEDKRSDSQISAISHPSFPETFDHFLTFAEKVLQFNVSGELLLTSVGNQSNVIQTSLTNYRKVYNQTRGSTKHIEKFRDIYGKCRPQFLHEVELDTFMDWFRKTSFVISPQEKSRSKILLTAIFRNCCRIAEHISEEAERNPDKADDLYDDPAAIYPEMFMLHLFRIFYHCADETDRTTIINNRIEEIEGTLGLTKNQVPVSSDGLNDLFSAATDMAKSIGLDVPTNAPQMSSGQFREAINTLTKDPSTREAIRDIFQGVDLKDPKNMPGAVGKILQRMQSNAEQPPEAIKRSLNATVENPTGKGK